MTNEEIKFYDINEILKEKDKLAKENKQLKEDKKKAIEFIKNAQYDDELKSYVYGLTYSGIQKLLEILGDKENE